MRVLHYDQGVLEIYNDVICKKKFVNGEYFESYFLLIADDYFHLNARNMNASKFTEKYHEYFKPLFANSNRGKEAMPYNIAPILYVMTTDKGVRAELFTNVSNGASYKFEQNVRLGYSNIKAIPVNKYFAVEVQ